MKTTLTANLALAAGAALAEGDLTVSAWILPRGLVPGATIVVATSDAEARSDGFGLFLGDDGALRAYAGAASAAENVAAGPRPRGRKKAERRRGRRGAPPRDKPRFARGRRRPTPSPSSAHSS